MFTPLNAFALIFNWGLFVSISLGPQFLNPTIRAYTGETAKIDMHINRLRDRREQSQILPLPFFLSLAHLKCNKKLILSTLQINLSSKGPALVRHSSDKDLL